MAAADVAAGSYDFLKLERVVWGRPAAEAVVAEAEARGADRVFIVASHSLNTKTPVVARIRDALGPRHAGTFDGCLEHAPRDLADPDRGGNAQRPRVCRTARP